jgi:hypothetical protein
MISLFKKSSPYDGGKTEWDDKLSSSPYGAAPVANNVLFTTTFEGCLYAFNPAADVILLRTPMPAGQPPRSPSTVTT